MQHHDAITGTHKKAVGEDYRRMMADSKRYTLLGGSYGAVSDQVQWMGASQGLEPIGLKECKIQGMTVICEDL